MTILAGAAYREGIAVASNGAPYVYGVASTAVVPVTETGSGSKVFPFFGIKVNGDGAIYVRFV